MHCDGLHERYESAYYDRLNQYRELTGLEPSPEERDAMSDRAWFSLPESERLACHCAQALGME
jgi:hypothetical protein